MPLYEYECKKCGHVTEILHGFDDKPEVACEDCESINTKKLISLCSFTFGNANQKQKQVSEAKKKQDMQNELRANYGIEKIAMASNSLGKTFEDTYNDIKKDGKKIAEAMKANTEYNAQRAAKKQKEWMKGAMKRTPKKVEKIKEMRAKEAFEKRAIKGVTTTK